MIDSTSSISRAATRFFSGTLLSRLSGLGRDIAMAFAFGTGPHVAAFLVAYRFAHLLRRLFGEGAMQSAFVPLFEMLKSEDPSRARRFFIHLMIALMAILFLIIVLGVLFLGSYLLFGHPLQSTSEVVQLTMIMLPSLFFICLYGLNSSLLQCHHFYFIPSISPVVFNAVWTIAVLLLLKTPEQQAMPYLAGSIILASLGQWLFTLPKTLSVLKTYPNVKGESDLWKIGTPMLLGTLGVAASQINNFMDALFARFASLDGPALLWYSVRVQQLPLALFGIALSGALLPALSRAFRNQNHQEYANFLSYALKRATLFLVPLSFAMVLLGISGITLIFGRGDFGVESITGTTKCLFAYASALWPLGMIQILAPAYYAKGDYRNPTKASVFAMALNIFLNGWFVFGLNMSAVSIALATGIAAWVNMTWLALGLYKTLPQFRSVLRCFYASIFIGVAGSLVILIFDARAIAPLAVQSQILLDETLFERLLQLTKLTALFSLGSIGTFLITKRHWE